MTAIPPHHALKETGIHFSIIAPAAFLERRGLFCILQDCLNTLKTTDVLSESVATGVTDHSNLRVKVQRYGGVGDVAKVHQGHAQVQPASHRLEFRIDKFANHDDLLS
jgi:hypothetical protein